MIDFVKHLDRLEGFVVVMKKQRSTKFRRKLEFFQKYDTKFHIFSREICCALQISKKLVIGFDNDYTDTSVFLVRCFILVIVFV